MNEEIYFYDYFEEWISLYKKGIVSYATYEKYKGSHKSLRSIAQNLKLSELNRRKYQELLNTYAKNHAVQTVKDFHRQLKACLSDAVDEEDLKINPARNVKFAGNPQKKTPPKFLTINEAKILYSRLDFSKDIRAPNWDVLFAICLNTGLRFSEALGLTPESFDFENQMLVVNKTFDYKEKNEIVHTLKTASSERKIVIPGELCELMERLITYVPRTEALFANANKKICASVGINRLRTLCKEADLPQIGIHGLRHTHASILFYYGVSLNSISRRLGHAKPSITQDTYLHIVKELETVDNEKTIFAIRDATTPVSAIQAFAPQTNKLDNSA